MNDKPVIDPDAVDHIMGVGGRDLLEHLIQLFLETAPQRVENARNAAADGDLETVHREAHALRSAAGNLGANRLASIASALELRAKSGGAVGLEKLVSGLAQHFAEVIDALKELAAEPDSEPPELPPPAPGAPVIVLVEDNPDSRILLESILTPTYRLRTFSQGRQALDAMAPAPPDLVILDISMPEMDGVQVLHCIRAHDRLRKLPVIALTAHAMAGDRERFLAEGFDAYLAKPVDEDELFAAIRRFLP